MENGEKPAAVNVSLTVIDNAISQSARADET